MTMPSAQIRLQTPDDYAALIEMNERAFGPGRFARTAYRVREGAMHDPRLNLCAVLEGKIIGSVNFTPIAVGGVPGALLLGPLIIAEDNKNQGHGLRLMLDGLERARELDYRLVILVGDLPYYARAGFELTPFERIALPGPVDPARILHVELIPGALKSYRGLVRGMPSQSPLPEGETRSGEGRLPMVVESNPFSPVLSPSERADFTAPRDTTSWTEAPARLRARQTPR